MCSEDGNFAQSLDRELLLLDAEWKVNMYHYVHKGKLFFVWGNRGTAPPIINQGQW